MNNAKRSELQELLTKLVDSVYCLSNEVIAKKRLKPERELFFRRKIHGFKYDDDGAHIQSWKSEKVLRKVWYKAITAVEQEIRRLSLYDSVLDKIYTEPALKQWSSPNYYLARFINIVAWKVIGGEITDRAELEPYVVSLLKYLNNEEQAYRLIAQLNGIVLQPKSIQLDENTLLRKPTRKDIETEYPAESFFLAGREIFEIPTAIMELTGTSSPNSVYLKPQIEINDAISILCLFMVGGIEYLKFTTDTDFLLALGLTSSVSLRLAKSGRYLVKNGDVKPLKTFWSNMKRIELPIPPHTGKQKEPTELSIAYERYSDALDVGITEKRISSAVMGLEALYLSPSERQELTYRLSMRAGKLLGQIGYSADKVREELTHAYDIRSTYVHGRTLTPKQRKEHEKKVGELNQFAQTIMDYLRASIVALLNRPSKTSLIDIIDNSFLDSAKDSEIRKLLFAPYEKEELNATG